MSNIAKAILIRLIIIIQKGHIQFASNLDFIYILKG